jgi:hypothetical protein
MTEASVEGNSTPTAATDSSVLGPFAPAWQPIATDAGEDETARAAREKTESSLRDELGLIVNAEHLVVLAGSGTSFNVTLGKDAPEDALRAPSLSELWDAVEALPAFESAKDKIRPETVATRNLELILSEAVSRLALGEDAELVAFVQAAESVVWGRCSFVGNHSDLTTHELFLRKVARRSTRLQRTQVFTTNYDMAIETAARRARFNVIDGFGYGDREFDGGSFDLDFVRRRPQEQLALEPSVFHLLKLHGSVDWDGSGGSVRKVVVEPATHVLIYPSVAKYQLSYQQPYLEFMSRFQIALRQPDVGLIVVGFGFNDEHLVAPIEAALRSNIGLRAVIVTPEARDSGRPETIAWIEDLIGRGDRRLTLLNSTFDELVRHLPDVPQMEERDAHSDRVHQRRPGEPRP